MNAAIGQQNLILPCQHETVVCTLNVICSTQLLKLPFVVDDLNNMPIKPISGGVLYVRDVANVRDGYAPQTNIVRVNGTRAVLMPIQKTGNASTLNIVNRIKASLPRIKDSLPPALKITLFADQSIFVTFCDQRHVVIDFRLPLHSQRLLIFLFSSGRLAQHIYHYSLHSSFHACLHHYARSIR